MDESCLIYLHIVKQQRAGTRSHCDCGSKDILVPMGYEYLTMTAESVLGRLQYLCSLFFTTCYTDCLVHVETSGITYLLNYN